MEQNESENLVCPCLFARVTRTGLGRNVNCAKRVARDFRNSTFIGGANLSCEQDLMDGIELGECVVFGNRFAVLLLLCQLIIVRIPSVRFRSYV